VKIWTSKPLICALAATFVSIGSAVAADGASKDDAVAMVKKAVAFIKEQGPEKSYPEVSNKAGKFIDRDLYVVVYQLDGKVLAHGSNEKFVGKDMSDAQDVDGKLLRQGARRAGGEAGIILAGLQVRQPSYKEGRAQADVLRTGR